MPAPPAPEPLQLTPEAPERPKAAPGLMRLRATAYFKDGMILGPDKAPKAWVEAGEVIEVSPGTFKQLKDAAPTNWTVL